MPVVATNDVRFLKADDFESHEARVCIHEGALLADAGARRRYTRQQYLRSPQEMAALFADVPEALANSVEIARRCSLVLKLGEARLPQYPGAGGRHAPRSSCELRRAWAAARGCAGVRPTRTRPAYRERLAASSMSSARWASPATS